MSRHYDVISEAERVCFAKKERLTKPRLAVLKIIASSPQALGAYEIIDQLSCVIDSPKPPTVYRAIDFWLKLGFIHRVESLAAYVICCAHNKHQGRQFLICKLCSSVSECVPHDLPEQLIVSASDQRFTPMNWNIEIYGVCNQCQS